MHAPYFSHIFQAFKYPIFGSQWHPEKNAYEWAMVIQADGQGYPYEAINHSAEAVEIAQYTASFFVAQARKNKHSFASLAAQQKALIYNFPVTKTTGDFVETYYFKNDFSPVK